MTEKKYYPKLEGALDSRSPLKMLLQIVYRNMPCGLTCTVLCYHEATARKPSTCQFYVSILVCPELSRAYLNKAMVDLIIKMVRMWKSDCNFENLNQNLKIIMKLEFWYEPLKTVRLTLPSVLVAPLPINSTNHFCTSKNTFQFAFSTSWTGWQHNTKTKGKFRCC